MPYVLIVDVVVSSVGDRNGCPFDTWQKAHLVAPSRLHQRVELVIGSMALSPHRVELVIGSAAPSRPHHRVELVIDSVVTCFLRLSANSLGFLVDLLGGVVHDLRHRLALARE